MAAISFSQLTRAGQLGVGRWGRCARAREGLPRQRLADWYASCLLARRWSALEAQAHGPSPLASARWKCSGPPALFHSPSPWGASLDNSEQSTSSGFEGKYTGNPAPFKMADGGRPPQRGLPGLGSSKIRCGVSFYSSAWSSYPRSAPLDPPSPAFILRYLQIAAAERRPARGPSVVVHSRFALSALDYHKG